MRKNNKKKQLSIEEFQMQELQGMREIFGFVSNLAMSNYINSTAVKVPEACYTSAKLGSGRLISQEFLLNRKKSRLDLSVPYGVMTYTTYGARGSILQRPLAEDEEIERSSCTISLPPHRNIKLSLSAAIRARRSGRNMTSAKMALQDASDIFYYGNGISGSLPLEHEGEDPIPAGSLGDNHNATLRCAPSGGGLFPIALYAVIRSVDGIRPGVYKYLPIHHSLIQLREMDEYVRNRMGTMASWGAEIIQENINLAILYVYDIYSNERKYSDMGLDFALIEAGMVSENIQLVSAAKNLSCCDIGGFDKKICEDVLGIDGITNFVLNLTIIGK